MSYSTKKQNKKISALLVNIFLDKDNKAERESSFEELERLVETAEIEIKGKFTQQRKSINSATYAGKGFIEQMKILMEEVDADLLIFNNNLAPSQIRNLKDRFKIDAIDRTEVILMIFKDHARTVEAKLQVRLAELKYEYPRLRGMWSHLDRQRGSSGTSQSGSSGNASGASGGGASRGVGEKQVEIDRRKMKQEITKVSREISKIGNQMEYKRKGRQDYKKVCLVGYTNAGKSTLFNALTHANVLVEDKLFATLDSKARFLKLEKGRDIVLSDTVGFIADLPHLLVASFRSTLKEVEDADLLLHVVDVSDENMEKHIKDVESVLREIEAFDIPQLLVFNKIDRISDDMNHIFPIIKEKYPDSIFISATENTNLNSLLDLVDKKMNVSIRTELLIPFDDFKIVDYIHKYGKILEEEYQDEGIFVNALFNKNEVKHLEKYVIMK